MIDEKIAGAMTMDKKGLGLLIREGESLTIEFKQSFSTKIDEDLVAFSNTRGGCVLLGVADDGSVPGFELTNETRGGILSLARNCKPSIDVSIAKIENVAVITVPEGHDKPYSCGKGYYRRLDGSTQKMGREELRLVFAQGEAELYEKKTTAGATLSSISGAKLSRFLKESKIDAGASGPEALLTSFSMLDEGRVNNAGVMFFAKDPRALISQCQSSMIAFKDTGGTLIYDRIDVKDDLLEQFLQAMLFLRKHLNVSSTIRGIRRTDEYELPLEALREAVANAIVHRDYTVRGTDLSIRVFPDRVEIANPAKIPPGTRLSELEGVSIRRNELIADMFFRLHVVERAGTGMGKMRSLMRSMGLGAPRIRLGLFYRIAFMRPGKRDTAKDTGKDTAKDTGKLSAKQATIMRLIGEDPHITADAIAAKIGINLRNTKKNISKLQERGLLKRVGPDRGGKWEVLK